MTTENKKLLWAGRVLTALAVLPFIFSFAMKVSGNPQMLQALPHLGWSQNMILTLAVLEGASVLLYLIPATSVLGAIILTGYLGGAIATHVRIGEHVFSYLRSIKNFQNWNPFVKPACQVKFDYQGTDGQVGFISAWNGDKQVGAGEQEIPLTPRKEVPLLLMGHFQG